MAAEVRISVNKISVNFFICLTPIKSQSLTEYSFDSLRRHGRFVEQRFDCCLEILARRLPDKLLANAPITIEQVGNRQTGTVTKLRADLFGAADNCVFLLHIFLKTANGISGIHRRNGGAHHGEAAPLKVFLHGVELGNLSPARNAPGRPEVQQNHTSSQRLEMKGLRVESLKLNLRRGLKLCTCGRRRTALGRL